MSVVHTFCNGVIPFIWDRLPLNEAPLPHNGKPCLDEDWFAEDCVAGGSPFVWRGRSVEESHRLLYRYARMENLKRLRERGEYRFDPYKHLLSQMLGIIALVVKAKEIGDEQRARKAVPHD